VDVQSKLPYLSVYMGHVSIVSTQRYLHFVEEIAACANQRFAARFSSLINASAGMEGGAR
jgi:hypothetical protein